jgi:hypothetical protein
MTQADRVHSTPRRTASLRKASPTKRSPLPPTDPETLPDLYCMKLDGDCLAPVVPDGAAVMIKKAETYGVGDVVCIWFRPEAISPGGHQAWLKRVTLNVPPWVKKFPYRDHPESECLAMIMVEQLNPLRSYAVKCSDILAIHKAAGYSAADVVIGGTVNEANMLQIGKGGGHHG